MYIVVTLARKDSTRASKYTEDVIKMLEFLSYLHIFPAWWTRFLTNGRHSNGNKLINCAPLLGDPFLPSYEIDIIADLIQKKENRLTR